MEFEKIFGGSFFPTEESLNLTEEEEIKKDEIIEDEVNEIILESIEAREQ